MGHPIPHLMLSPKSAAPSCCLVLPTTPLPSPVTADGCGGSSPAARLRGGLHPRLLEVLRAAAKVPRSLCSPQQPAEAGGTRRGGAADAVAMLALASNFQIVSAEKLLPPLSQAAMLAPSRGGVLLKSTCL